MSTFFLFDIRLKQFLFLFYSNQTEPNKCQYIRTEHSKTILMGTICWIHFELPKVEYLIIFYSYAPRIDQRRMIYNIKITLLTIFFFMVSLN